MLKRSLVGENIRLAMSVGGFQLNFDLDKNMTLFQITVRICCYNIIAFTMISYYHLLFSLENVK